VTQAQRIARFVEYGFLIAGLTLAALLMQPEARAGIGIGMVLMGLAQIAFAEPAAHVAHRKPGRHARSQARLADGVKGTTRYYTTIGGILAVGGVVFILSVVVG